MPTGYTYNIKDGISFKHFILQCARAFGACITMRDDHADTPIPDAFVVDDYHKKDLERAKQEMRDLLKMSADAVHKANEEYYQRKLSDYHKTLAGKAILRESYNKMLAEAKKWQPPTSEHVGLQDFMVQQIEASIKFDCSTNYIEEPKQITDREWIEQRKKSIQWAIDYHTKEQAAEEERVTSRNKWLADLRKSIENYA